MLFRMLILIASSVFSVAVFADPPEWYAKQGLTPEKNYIYIGYGSGVTMAIAKQMAREDIANQLLVVVDSQMEIKKELSDGEFTSSAQQHTRQSTFAKLRNLSVVESTFADNTYFVSLKYENLSLPQYFLQKINLTDCSHQSQHPYLQHTPLFKSLNEKLPCLLDVRLVRKNRAWMLEYQNVLSQISPEMFTQLYVNAQAGDLRVQPSATRVVEGNVFDVVINAKQSGFVSLFNVYADGVVSLLQENIPVDAGIDRPFPTEKDKFVFEAATLEKGKESIEMYIGLFSPSNKNYSRFKEAGIQIEKNDSQYQFHYLLNLMRDQAFSAVLIRILPSDI